MTTAITPVQSLGPWVLGTAGTLDVAPVAADVAGNTFVGTGREIVLIYNPAGGSTYTATFTSQPDEKTRSATITSYSMAAGDWVCWTGALTNSPGWKDATTGIITITCNSATVLILVLRLPVGYPG
jgi:hypothetical protein